MNMGLTKVSAILDSSPLMGLVKPYCTPFLKESRCYFLTKSKLRSVTGYLKPFITGKVISLPLSNMAGV